MPAADDYDLCTDIPRGEWGFNGLIMTDWGGGQSTPVNSMHAGNDLIMPGGSSANIIAQFTNTAPTFDETTGYVKYTVNSRGVRSENWGEFTANAEGTDEVSVTVAADVDVAANADIQAKVAAGTAVITVNEDGTKTVTYKGNFAAKALPLGDLQKSAAHVLNVIMAWAIANGIINGVKDSATGTVKLNPSAPATRAQIAALVSRSLNRI